MPLCRRHLPAPEHARPPPHSHATRHRASTLAAAAALSLAAQFAAAQTSSAPQLTVTPVMSELRGPWDIGFAPGGALLFTEKCQGLSVRLADGSVRRLFGRSSDYTLPAQDLFCQGQSGVHGVAVDPDFAQGRRAIYVFSASNRSTNPRTNRSTNPRTNRVIRLTVNEDWTQVGERTDIVTDIPYKESGAVGSPGAHSGGRIRFGPDGYLWITTGDNHAGELPQHPTRLGGKVLRVDRDGKPAAGNNPPAGFDPRIYTYGHRNVQGIAFRPAGQPNAGQAFVAEHGPNHSDEVTALVPGGNAGWDPRDRPGLNCPDNYCGYAGNMTTMPMTDSKRFPQAMRPLWSNGARSDGMGPAEFLSGAQWGAWDGHLAVSLMRAGRLDVLGLEGAAVPGAPAPAVTTARLPSLRLRSLRQGPDGALWASTDDGKILRVAPGPASR